MSLPRTIDPNLARAPVTYRASDTFVMKPGFTGVWRTIETVRKIYFAVT
jgi:uncharacterized protein